MVDRTIEEQLADVWAMAEMLEDAMEGFMHFVLESDYKASDLFGMEFAAEEWWKDWHTGMDRFYELYERDRMAAERASTMKDGS